MNDDDQSEWFSMWIGTKGGAEPIRVMKTPDYNFAKKSTVRRVYSRYKPNIEASEQPVIGQIRNFRDEVIFQLRRVVQEHPSGKVEAFLVLDKDWQFEDSPLIGQRVKIGAVDAKP